MHEDVYLQSRGRTQGRWRWSAVIPTLSGCATWGDTETEALNSLREAAQAYVEVLVEQGRER
ncbi:MAG: type II toxin-antitoxin system HicB family antitoxin [Chloroflexi bacterium]|nr:type II toxin-antitoxin system HicB family antitoxin [Chloroflexota bacterium]